MNKILVVASMVVLALAFVCGSPETPVFRAGASAVDVTPKVWPLPMVGSFSYRRPTLSRIGTKNSASASRTKSTETNYIVAVSG